MSATALAVLTTVLAFSSLYAPQPLLPLLASELAITADEAGLLISVTLVPLALAPVFYGALLESVSARRLLRIGVAGLALSQLAFAAAPTFAGLVAARLFQGLLLPAVFTSLMTYLASRAQGAALRRTMSVYVAATILGGFSGRMFAGGLVSAGVPWRGVFVALAVMLLVVALVLGGLPASTRASFRRLRLDDVFALFRRPLYRRAYGIIFLVFFVFASLLNLVPFRLKALDEGLGELAIAASYSSYGVGIVMALGSVRIARRLGGELRAIRGALVAYLAAVVGFVVADVRAVFALLWLLCAGMFLVHALLSGIVNEHGEQKGLVNGVYLASYYLGGTLGAFLPAILYRWAGWNVYVGALAGAVILAGALAMRLRADELTPT